MRIAVFDLGAIIGHWVHGVSPVRVAVSCDFAAAQRRFEIIQKRHEDYAPVVKDIARIIRRDLAAQFSSGGEPPWQALKPSTLAAKRFAGLPPKMARNRNLVMPRLRQNGGATNVLIATGALRDSYVRKGARGHFEETDPKTAKVVVGSQLKTRDTNAPLAVIHQFGTSPYVILPRRARRLAFIGSGGYYVFRRSVRHPGLPARPVGITRSALELIASRMQSHLVGEDNAGEQDFE